MRAACSRTKVQRIIFRLAMVVSTLATVCKLCWPGPMVRICGHILAALGIAVVLMGAPGSAAPK